MGEVICAVRPSISVLGELQGVGSEFMGVVGELMGVVGELKAWWMS